MALPRISQTNRPLGIGSANAGQVRNTEKPYIPSQRAKAAPRAVKPASDTPSEVGREHFTAKGRRLWIGRTANSANQTVRSSICLTSTEYRYNEDILICLATAEVDFTACMDPTRTCIVGLLLPNHPRQLTCRLRNARFAMSIVVDLAVSY